MQHQRTTHACQLFAGASRENINNSNNELGNTSREKTNQKINCGEEKQSALNRQMLFRRELLSTQDNVVMQCEWRYIEWDLKNMLENLILFPLLHFGNVWEG